MNAETISPIRVWIFGSDPKCDVVMSQGGVAPQHCLLAQYETGYAVEDLGSGRGTWLNGRELSPRQPEWVGPEDRILLGGSVKVPWPENGVHGTSALPPNSAAQSIITIGRDPESTVVLDYPMISWNHARLMESGGRVFLEDLGSTNGTAINHPENRIKRAEVRSHESVFFGSFKVRVSRLLEPGKLALGAAVQETVPFKGEQLVIGRDPECSYPLVS